MINNKYCTNSFVGKGGSANAFLVTDPEGCKYAAKVLREDTGTPMSLLKKMIAKEAEVLQSLSAHPNVIRCYEVLDNAQVHFEQHSESVNGVILEYAPNGSLSDFIKKTGFLEEDLGCFIFIQLLNVVRFMHESNIAHCDIKPHNILLDEYFNVKVADFGT